MRSPVRLLEMQGPSQLNGWNCSGVIFASQMQPMEERRVKASWVGTWKSLSERLFPLVFQAVLKFVHAHICM